jgi:hypothetical protein
MQDCPTIRRVKITKSKFNMLTGVTTPVSEEVVTQPCGTPLFGKDEVAGICQACAKGWSVEDNRPATPEEIAEYEKSLPKSK